MIGCDIMEKTSVFICASIDLAVNTRTIVRYAGEVIVPELVYGRTLENNCRGILVPYGSDITIKTPQDYDYYLMPYCGNSSVYNTFMVISAGGSMTFKAVRDLFIKDIAQNTYAEIQP